MCYDFFAFCYKMKVLCYDRLPKKIVRKVITQFFFEKSERKKVTNFRVGSKCVFAKLMRFLKKNKILAFLKKKPRFLEKKSVDLLEKPRNPITAENRE